ncbi:RNA polymerase sigma-70 factor, ECF subfamily [Dyadobacter koreensis]|uniref:RNA polymerase sigma-70 factor, ECF subfamily n=1 Tax=Dyadobacter koreensis TaxID=408657 RepID=A0A1H6UNS1_9BACT|nr:sigma-70 family RNA polymerase sigma factor [Dyadobacter koreensis]SEI93949.1 RNA polymerase sigma-70 factor, ECF subfamily [Dyadobacter koreensis]
MSYLNESKILQQISEGDEKAFSELYFKFKPDLYRLVNSILKSQDLTNDTCQEVFIKIWEDRHRLCEIHSFKSYLLATGKNHSLNILRKISFDERRMSVFVSNYNESCNGIEERMQTDEYYKFLQSVLSTLTPQTRRVFQLCRQQGMSYDEAGEAMGVSKSLIKKHMIRSMKILRSAVERDLGIALSILMSSLTDV